jgi:hypothetical protein
MWLPLRITSSAYSEFAVQTAPCTWQVPAKTAVSWRGEALLVETVYHRSSIRKTACNFAQLSTVTS